MHAWASRLTRMATGVTGRHSHGATVYYRRPSGKSVINSRVRKCQSVASVPSSETRRLALNL